MSQTGHGGWLGNLALDVWRERPETHFQSLRRGSYTGDKGNGTKSTSKNSSILDYCTMCPRNVYLLRNLENNCCTLYCLFAKSVSE